MVDANLGVKKEQAVLVLGLIALLYGGVAVSFLGLSPETIPSR